MRGDSSNKNIIMISSMLIHVVTTFPDADTPVDLKLLRRDLELYETFGDYYKTLDHRKDVYAPNRALRTVYALKGALDASTSLELATQWVTELSGHQMDAPEHVIPLDGVGHQIYLDAPEQVANVLRQIV